MRIAKFFISWQGDHMVRIAKFFGLAYTDHLSEITAPMEHENDNHFPVTPANPNPRPPGPPDPPGGTCCFGLSSMYPVPRSKRMAGQGGQDPLQRPERAP